MDTIVKIIIRAAVLGAALLLYTWLVVGHTSVGDDALGAGLLAFLLLVGTALVWGLVDGRALRLGRAALVWAAVSALLAIGWTAVGALAGDTDPAFVPFVFLLVLVPAGLGAASGHLLRSRVATAG